ncbi:MAG: dihydrodipicolinate reductase C-terminal domain-containing protein [Bacteroidales bacterium]
MKIVISGYGKMGKEIEKAISTMPNIELVQATEDISSIDEKVASDSVCIDFTTPSAFRSNYKVIADKFKAVVVGTTGWYDIKDEIIGYFIKKGTPMIYASNFSIGVNIFFKLSEISSKLLSSFDMYQPYIIEKHHIHKLDAPSGTAKTIGHIVENNFKKPVDIQSVRCGEISGIHTLGYESVVDRITMEHEAFSRAGFARGAIQAALWTSNMKGVHEFRDLLEDQFKKLIDNE